MAGRAQRAPAVRGTAERDALVLANLKLVPHMLKRLRHVPDVRRLGEEDALQEGYLRLLRAAELWRAGGVVFNTYACRAIASGILSAARTLACKAPECLPLRLGEGDGVGRTASKANPPEAPPPACDPLLAREATLLLRRLHPHRRFVVRRVVQEERLLHEVGKRLRCSRERVRALRDESLGWLREKMLGGRPDPLGGKMSSPGRLRRRNLPS